jgi:WD40 repeat protein
LREERKIVVVNGEKDLFFLRLKNFKDNKANLELVEELAGCNDLVMDLKFMKLADPEDERNNLIAIASNSDKLRLVDLRDRSNLFLYGHTDILMCLDTREEYIFSSSKDTTIKMWKVENTPTLVRLS